MKTLIVLMVMASVAFSVELVAFDPNGALTSESVYPANWMRIYEAEMTYVDSVVIFAENLSDLLGAKVGVVPVRTIPSEFAGMPTSATYCDSLGAYRIVVEIGEPITCEYGYLYVELWGCRIRATGLPVRQETYYTGPDYLNYDANVIFYGTPGVSLQRDTWASIKASF